MNTLVVKQSEGTQVCTNCGIVTQVGMIDQTNEKRDYATEGAADHSGNRVQAQGGSALAAFQSQQLVIAGNSKEANKLKINYMVKKAMSNDVY